MNEPTLLDLPAALLKTLPTLPLRIERSGLALREFTCMLRLADSEKNAHLPVLLKTFDDRIAADLKHQTITSAFSRAAGLHSARLMLLGDTDRRHARQEGRESASNGGRVPEGPLVFNLIFDGSLDDLLLQLLQESDELTTVFAYCEGFPGHTPETSVRSLVARAIGRPPDLTESGRHRRIIAWLKRARLKGAYFFSDVDDQSRDEIDDAARLWRAFHDFYVQHQGAQDAAVLRRAFSQFWQKRDEETIDTPFARDPATPEELRWIRRAVDLIARSQKRDNRARAREGAAPARQVHVKSHGCLDARFRVHDRLPAAVRHGIFARPATYQARIRLSNGGNLAGKDATPDGRGMAIKLYGIEGERAIDRRLAKTEDYSGTQDFLLLNHPNFFAANAEDFAVFFSALSLEFPAMALPLACRFLRRPRALRIMLQTYFQRVNHPLDVSYFSGTPYALGNPKDEAALTVKYLVRPKLQGRRSFARAKPDRKHPNFLSKALAESLHPLYGEVAELEFCLMLAPPALAHSFDDAMADWKGAEVVPVATITIAPQDFSGEVERARCEQLQFNLWNALAVHRPLGSLNRMRLPAYLRSVKERDRSDGLPRPRWLPRGGYPPPHHGFEAEE